ncbi:MAG: hypothetical protein AAFY63_08730 [Cyanobacteria bacterium J06643_13]
MKEDEDGEKFIAIALEKSKKATNWEDSDRFNLIVLTKASDQEYYLTRIEHYPDILSPRYVDNDGGVFWREESINFGDKELINDLYSLNDSRDKYTVTINEKPYSFCEKYICYTISASYELWGNEVSPFLRVCCQLSSCYSASRLSHLPTKFLEYRVNINHLLQTSIFQYRPFEIWHGKVIVDELKVKLIP